MALRFIEGFDHYNSFSQISNKGWTVPGGTVGTTTGRFGGAAITMANRSLIKVIDAQNEWIVGMAVKNSTAISGPLIQFRNGSTIQCDLYHDHTSGFLHVRRNGVTTIASGTAVLAVGTWYYVEFRLLISDTVGEAEVRVNGAIDINAGTLDTLQSGSTADRFYIGDAGVTNIQTIIDDMYFLDTTGGGTFADFLGDNRVEVIYPNGNGTTSDFVGQDANSTDNYLNVDETSPNSDTDYNESATVGEKDTYAMDVLATTAGTVYAVQPSLWARKTDSGPRTVCSVARLSGTEEDSADHALGAGYTYYTDLRTTKPGGGGWTIADIAATEFGMKITA